MTISPVSTVSVPEARETKVNGRDRQNDHDQNDAAAKTAPLSTQSASGQPVGSLVNRTA